MAFDFKYNRIENTSNVRYTIGESPLLGRYSTYMMINARLINSLTMNILIWCAIMFTLPCQFLADKTYHFMTFISEHQSPSAII